jgi:hypothetical protein
VLAAGFLAGLCLSSACARRAGETAVAWHVVPPVPVVGTPTRVRCILQGAEQPVRRARLRLEAHMAHPGMAPVTADLIEQQAGVYETRIELTMAGPWTLVVAGELPDGTWLTQQTAITAVEPSR